MVTSARPADVSDLAILPATDSEREWAAGLMAGSDPWITLGRGLDQCLVACRRPDYLLFIAHDRDQACGFALLHPRGLAGSPYLASIAVAAEWRNRGVGAALLDFCEAHFSTRDRHFFLCVSSFNLRARAFYERHGYRQVGELPDYVIAGASEILMWKRLGPR